MTHRLRLLPLFLGLAAITAGCGDTGSATAAAQSEATPPPLIDVVVATASSGRIESTLHISGTLAPRARVGLTPKLTGTLERIFVDIGDPVTAGQTIATIDRRDIDAQADAAVAAGRAAGPAEARAAIAGPDGLRVPLFAAPGAAARRGVAEAQARQAEHGLNAALDAARLELESGWTSLGAAAEVVASQEAALDLARESVSIAQVSYENGVITSAELSDAQVRLLQTEWLLMQAKYSRIVAAARAKVAAGVE